MQFQQAIIRLLVQSNEFTASNQSSGSRNPDLFFGDFLLNFGANFASDSFMESYRRCTSNKPLPIF
jgi:hypothetical protein